MTGRRIHDNKLAAAAVAFGYAAAEQFSFAARTR
jgi:hypothetical protein